MSLLHRLIIKETCLVYILNKMLYSLVKTIHSEIKFSPTNYTFPQKRNKTVATRLLQDYDKVNKVKTRLSMMEYGSAQYNAATTLYKVGN